MSDESQFILAAEKATFRVDNAGQLSLSTDGSQYEVGMVARAFPLSEAEKMIVVRDKDGEELAIIDDLTKLDDVSREALSERLEKSYFMPQIKHVYKVEEHLGIVAWDVETDRGRRTFEVRSVRQNTRRIGRWRVIIRDVDGNRYEIKNWGELNEQAQQFIEQYI